MMFFRDLEFQHLASVYIPKVISIAEKALYIKKTLKKKKICESKLETKTVARVIAFCLFIRYYLASK